MSRSTGYSAREDHILCEAWLEVSQDPIVGRYQSADNFWGRIVAKYNETLSEQGEGRSLRSVQSRMHNILTEVKRLVSCVKTIENRHQSGASDEDNMRQAKILFMHDAKYKKRFKFDHVWHIMKDIEKFKDNVSTVRHMYREPNYDSSQSEKGFDSPCTESPGLSPFASLDELEDNLIANSSRRPIGVKKAKLKRKTSEESSTAVNEIREENRQLLELLQDARLDRKTIMSRQKEKDENKILFANLKDID
ncbi:hypothetical protein Sjap_010754 [Stephania japonica]|uniref:No apical meristem-associated C-terminal domain-containing protein n=1 Tax=Stephania japonica TaxID=461633 RepID=A0AAP0P3Z9_9MAGN